MSRRWCRDRGRHGGRSATARQHAKLREIVPPDLYDLSALDLKGFDACFFCLGVSAVGMSEQEYRRVTYDLTVSAARTLASANPDLVFVYVSGSGTSEESRMMWARIKGAAESAVLALPFKGYAMRPGVIQPMDGIRSKTGLYRTIYAISGPMYPLLKRMFPRSITSTRQVGQAMLNLAKRGAPNRIIEGKEINSLAEAR
jgi:uncharacterized protein YbjT (DUF2867 family)